MHVPHRSRVAHGERELPWDQDNHPGSPELSDQHHTPAGAAAAAGPAALDDRAAPDAQAALDARYGRNADTRRRGKLLAVVIAVAIAVVFAVWVIWAGPGQTDHGLDTDDVGYEVVSDHSVVVHTQVAVDPGTTVECAVQALDKSYTIVGWRVVTLPAEEQRSRSISTPVNTTTRAVTGLIHSCWVP
ncbi:DUF4307 domain-containing protein [Curtobacterium aetherium]|uniref:DUF4307 domain-containing protein n=1 Tax=Curtobacterium aetherium TaxID=2841594 RepID=A0ACD1E162_9MICO|nr:DUF4307 domain-containing protein [Curtobacterium sp. L6-1]QWS32476.1 DUF4307 domain-containing protein [Curtobacterium sp. L6-1]